MSETEEPIPSVRVDMGAWRCAGESCMSPPGCDCRNSEFEEATARSIAGFLEKIQKAKDAREERNKQIESKKGCGEKCPNCTCGNRKQKFSAVEKYFGQKISDMWYGDGK